VNAYLPSGGPPPDPGWRPVTDHPVRLLRGMLAGRGRRLQPTDGEPLILGLRAAVAGSVTLVGVALVALAFLLPLVGEEPVRPTEQWWVGAAAVGTLVAWVSRLRPLPCVPEHELGERYATTVLLGAGAAELAALIGFIAAIVLGALWPYLTGIALYGLGLVLVAPTAADVERRDGRLRRGGCPRSLPEAVLGPM
jgi:hypothetical protein